MIRSIISNGFRQSRTSVFLQHKTPFPRIQQSTAVNFSKWMKNDCNNDRQAPSRLIPWILGGAVGFSGLFLLSKWTDDHEQYKVSCDPSHDHFMRKHVMNKTYDEIIATNAQDIENILRVSLGNRFRSADRPLHTMILCHQNELEQRMIDEMDAEYDANGVLVRPGKWGLTNYQGYKYEKDPNNPNGPLQKTVKFFNWLPGTYDILQCFYTEGQGYSYAIGRNLKVLVASTRTPIGGGRRELRPNHLECISNTEVTQLHLPPNKWTVSIALMEHFKQTLAMLKPFCPKQ